MRQITVQLYTGATITQGRPLIWGVFTPVSMLRPHLRARNQKQCSDNGTRSISMILSQTTFHIEASKTNIAVAGDVSRAVADNHLYCFTEVNGVIDNVTLTHCANAPIGALVHGVKQSKTLNENGKPVWKFRSVTVSCKKGYEPYMNLELLFMTHTTSGVCDNAQGVNIIEDANPYSRIQTTVRKELKFEFDENTELLVKALSNLSIPANTLLATLTFEIE